MIKLLFRLILILAVLVVAINLFGGFLLGGVMEKAIGAPVKAGRLYLNVFTSKAGLVGFKIQNPEGFRRKTLAEIREISLQYDVPSLFSGTVRIPEMRLDFGDVTVEKNSSGKINLMELGAMKGMFSRRGGDSGGGGQPARKKGKGPAVKIDQAFVNIGKVYYVDSGLNQTKEYDLGIRNERFRNVTNTPGLVRDISMLILRKVGMSSLGQNFLSTVDSIKRNFF